MKRELFRRRRQTTAAEFLTRVRLDSTIPGEEIKKIEAIIQPFKLDRVKAALAVRELQGFTVTEVQGCGRQKGHSSLHRGAEYALDLRQKVKLEILVPALQLAGVCETAEETARTGDIGDGEIFVTRVEEVVRIRTGARGAEAIQ